MMKGRQRLFYLMLALTMMSAGLVGAQASEAETTQSEKPATCSGPVYKAKDVSRRVKIVDYPAPAGEPEGERGLKEKGRVVLRAVLCRTGEVTDIEVVKGLPDGLTEKAVEAAGRIKFNPAERRGQKVSQRVTIEYTFRISN
jgi:TonB family protein